MHIRHHKYSQLGGICGAGISDWVRNWLEKATAPHSSTFAYKIPWTEEPGRLQFMGLLELDTTERLHFHFSLSCIGEGNGNPLHCSCLENSRDGGAWWAAVYEVAQSRTRLKWLSGSSRKRKKCQECVCTEEMPHEATTRKEPSARWEGSKASPETNAVSTL